MVPQETRPPSIFTSRFVQSFILIFLFVALIQGQKDLILFAIFILVLMNIADLWSRFSLSGVETKTIVDKEKVFPEEKIRLRINAENNKLLPIWLRVDVPVHGALLNKEEENRLTKDSGLLWFQRVMFSWELYAEKRGIYPIGPPRIILGDLLGFYPRERGSGNDIQIVVYPRLVPLRPFPIPKKDYFGTPGSKSPVQDPVYILGTRDYQHWMPSRYIHWKASARRNRLQEKIFEPSEQAKVLLLVDVAQFQEEQAEDDFERTLEVVASLAMELDGKGYALGFATNGLVEGGRPQTVPIARNSRQLSVIMEILAGLKMVSRTGLKDIIRKRIPFYSGVSCVCFFYKESQGIIEAGRYLAQKKVPVISISKEKSIEKETEPLKGLHYSLDEVRMESPGM